MDLISRVCLCGCGKAFRVLKGNETNFFYSGAHEKLASSRRDEIGALARSALKKRNRSANTIQGKRLTKSARAKLKANRYEIKSDMVWCSFIEPPEDEI